MDNKKEWISNKIGILIREGRSKEQAAAIAFSMWERGDHHKMQQGGLYGNDNTGFFNMNNPYLPISFEDYEKSNQQQANISKGYDPNMGYTGYVQGDFNMDGVVDAKDKTDKFGQSSTTAAPTQYDDFIKYNILNPYNNGMDLNTSLMYTGQQFGQGNTGRGIAGAGLSALKGIRSFLSGYGAGQGQFNLENQMRNNLYNNDANLYTRTDNYQQGGRLPYYQEAPYPVGQEDIYGQDLINKYPNAVEVDARLIQQPVEPTITGTAEAGTEALQSAQVAAQETKNFDANSARDTWVKKTGLPWSEAKRLGYTDGTAKDNIKLLGELNDPRFKKENLRSTPFTAPVAQAKAAQKEVQKYMNSPEFKSLPKKKQKEVMEKSNYEYLTSDYYHERIPKPLDKFRTFNQTLQELVNKDTHNILENYKKEVLQSKMKEVITPNTQVGDYLNMNNSQFFKQEGGFSEGYAYDLTDDEIHDLLKGKKITGYKFNPDTQQYEVEYE